MNQLSKLGIDNHITSINKKDEIDYEAETKNFYDNADAIDKELNLVTEDYRECLRGNGYSEGEIMILEESGFFDSAEFYEMLFEMFSEELIKIYVERL